MSAPKPGTTWTHTNGCGPYVVVAVTEERPGHPSHVIYQGRNGKWWVRPVSEWAAKMVPEWGRLTLAAEADRTIERMCAACDSLESEWLGSGCEECDPAWSPQ